MGPLLGVTLGFLMMALLQFRGGMLQAQRIFQEFLWVLIRVDIVIVIIIVLVILVPRHSCDATLMEVGSEIILIETAINK